jgi:hypothetical protein
MTKAEKETFEKFQQWEKRKLEIEQEAAESDLAYKVRTNDTYTQVAQTNLQRVEFERRAAEVELKRVEQNRVNMCEYSRPSRLHNADLSRVGTKWKASVGDVVAHGDTPEMACAEFDHLWLFGDRP